VLEALLWGAAAASSLIAGALVALAVTVPDRVVGLLMAFGAGTLISAVSFDLADEALRSGGLDALAVGLAAGALAFYLGDRALALGALLDGVPEQAAIGLGLASGGAVGVALVAAVFLSNVPESLASAAAMRRAGRPRSHVLRLWGGVTIACALATVLGYVALESASGNLRGAVSGFAGGAILVMLADAMIPEALQKGGRTAGLVTTLGFALAVLLSQVSG
jgi:zinc transporter, ZIP family